MPILNKIELADLIPEPPTNGFSLFSYWDNNLVCRFINVPGLEPADAVGKLSLRDFLGAHYAEASPHVSEALNGKIQTLEQSFVYPSAVKTVSSTFIPGFSDGKIEGIYLYVSDTKEIPSLPANADRYHTVPTVALPPVSNHLEKIATILRTSILKGFPGIAELSKKHFISASKLKRDFKNGYHVTMFEYYRLQQMAYAHRYLSQGIYNKKQMALMLNFSNPSNFSAAYRKYLRYHSQPSSEAEVTTYDIYKKFIEHAPSAMALLNAGLEFLAASELWINKFGLEAKGLAGRCVYDEIPEMEANVRAGLQSCVESINGLNAPFSTKIVDKNIHWKIWSFVSPPGTLPEVKGILIIADEIGTKDDTENKSHDIHHKTHELLNIGSWTRDLKNNTTYWSPKLKEMLEVPNDFAPDLETAMNFYQEGPSREKALKGLQEALKNGTPFDLELQMVTAKGKIINVRLVGYPEFKDGICERISGVFQQLD